MFSTDTYKKLMVGVILFYALGSIVSSVSHYVEDSAVLDSIREKDDRLEAVEASLEKLQEKVDKLEKTVQNQNLN